MKDTQVKRLFRSREDRMLGGLLGGVGEYLGVDPVAVRAAFILIAAVTGFVPALIAYVICLLMIPQKK